MFGSYEEIECAFSAKTLHPGDLKRAVGDVLNEIMSPIRDQFSAKVNPELAALVEQAYPSAKPVKIEDISRLDIRVGKVIESGLHPTAGDRLIVSRIDLGEEDGPRTIVSGLVGHVDPAELSGRHVVVLANLKPSNFKGGMCGCQP